MVELPVRTRMLKQDEFEMQLQITYTRDESTRYSLPAKTEQTLQTNDKMQAFSPFENR